MSQGRSPAPRDVTARLVDVVARRTSRVVSRAKARVVLFTRKEEREREEKKKETKKTKRARALSTHLLRSENPFPRDILAAFRQVRALLDKLT